MSSNARQDTFTLIEIANWTANNEVSLPTVQRGFVWRPTQIENLWDSLLRGYPIGAFVLSPSKTGKSFEILDGQQRATAICLGMGAATFRNSEKTYRVFIDLIEPAPDDQREYVFRVITKSHPWGYQRSDNTRVLTSDAKVKAMKEYGIEDHLSIDSLNPFYPYDAQLPVPFSCFMDMVSGVRSTSEVMSAIQSWELWPKLLNEWLARDTQNNTVDMISAKVARIAAACARLCDKETGRRVPTLYLELGQITKSVSNEIESIDDSSAPEVTTDEEQDRVDEIENLFVRLNAGGTPLQGEELNYSILKAHIKREVQDELETQCHNLINPARFVSIAYRLFQQQHKDSSRDSTNMKVKPKQFQRAIGEDKEQAFAHFLVGLLNEKSYPGGNILSYTRLLLRYDAAKATFGLPQPILLDLGNSAPELCFLIMYRILVKNDRITIGSPLHRRLVGMITLFKWFGKNGGLRDFRKLLNNIWPSARVLKTEQFWSSLTVSRARIADVLAPFPRLMNQPDKSLLASLTKLPPRSTGLWQKLEKEQSTYRSFVKTAFEHGDILLYAQREFLAYFFKDEHFQLEDTDAPFDWDHLSPNSLVNRRWNMPEAIRSVYQTNGNFRVWPYSLNRMDQDVFPSVKLNPLAKETARETDIDFWNRFIARNSPQIKSKAGLSKQLLNWSACSDDWLSCNVEDLTKDREWQQLYSLIVDRNIQLLKEWYEALDIEALIPENTKFVEDKLLQEKEWQTVGMLTPSINKHFDNPDSLAFVSKTPLLSDTNLRLFISISRFPEEQLKERYVEFGFVEVDEEPLFKQIEIPDRLKPRYLRAKPHWLWGEFTLIASTSEAYGILKEEFIEWTGNIPDKKFAGLTNQLRKLFR